MQGMGSHQLPNQGKNNEWLTPPSLMEELGEFDLDPCSPHPASRPWKTALNHYHEEMDGLSQEWFGNVWLNPPYGRETATWMERLVKHGRGMALIFARTETKIFFPWVWEYADAIYFIKSRLYFHYVDGTRAKANSGAPSVLVAYGKDNVEKLERLKIEGKLIYLKTRSNFG